ncbi:addiction module protein [Subsaximicrobium wynnwilliamsii]|uniref:Addiction module protein n=1 Tax=Subsaximicrobium wynnwilliamsii TaxID=291179 RepID=A0A5C6ZCE0_9FLAO|nr:addiction module protein [Subsaximicrobium wynnwilliamsii]TXD81894.1 addiction module protein [Subsaximicrobium wynnwilliamsii]TXD86784.1 addiction module protein [Subsaximicrobium wynnwilliamsii]TXE01345.1 addiction module protein [Subsaximicrobium wynnwilliamsii]
MDIKAEKIELMKLLLDVENEGSLAELRAVLIADNEAHKLSSAQETELDYRLKRYESGETKFYSWEEVEEKLKAVL